MIKTLLLIIQLLYLFIMEELKVLKNRILYLNTFFKEVKLINYLVSKFLKDKNDLFKISYQNDYLKLLKKIYYKNQEFNTSKKVFVESFINHPTYTLPNCSISEIISKNKKIDTIGILRKGDIKGSQIFNSFGIKKIFYIDNGNIFLRLYYFFKAYIYLKKVKSVSQLIKLKIDKIDFGQAIYEQFIRFKKKPDIYEIYNDFYILLGKALFLNYQFKKIFKNEKNSYLVQSETQYFPFRISLQNALKFNLKVVSKRGISITGIRMFKTFNERNENRNKITKKFFHNYYIKYKKNNKNKWNKFFLTHTSKNLGKEIYQQLEKKIELKKIIHSRKEFCKRFDLNSKYPTVLILAHELTDGNLNNKWNIFENDMFWLEQTLKKISNLKKINWIIKPHPSEKIYNSKIDTVSLFKVHCQNSNNIRLFPTKYFIKKPNKIFKCAITSHGTAGHEYPGFGVPTIICGDTPYSELGFNLEPKNKKEYFRLLKNIKNLKKMKPNQILKSKLFNYLLNSVCVVKNPIMYETDITMKYDKKVFWQKSLYILKKYKNFDKNFINSLNYQINNDNSLLINLKKKLCK
jgi:hypothetical protein